MKIVTLTLNPALDKSSAVDRLLPDDKLRCDHPTFEPGGGGINVSRAIRILGGESLAIYLAGGHTGEMMKDLLTKEGVHQKAIDIKSPTRENFIVMEKSTGKQYRFGMPGAEVSEQELQKCLDELNKLPDDVEFIVASGSLPEGAPVDFYGEVVKIARKRNIQCVVDTSGEALLKAAQQGVCLLKPNLKELSQLGGKEYVDAMDQEKFAKKLIDENKAKMLAISLGPRGAMLATKDYFEYVVPPTVKQDSTVGAGDCMVAGMVLSLSRGEDLSEMIRWGVAAGTAATMTPGTELCRRKDVEEIYQWLKEKKQHITTPA